MGLFGKKKKEEQVKEKDTKFTECGICGILLNLEIQEELDHLRFVHPPFRTCSQCKGDNVYPSHSPNENEPEIDEEFIANIKNVEKTEEYLKNFDF